MSSVTIGNFNYTEETPDLFFEYYGTIKLDGYSAEILAYDRYSQRLFTIYGGTSILVTDLSNLTAEDKVILDPEMALDILPRGLGYLEISNLMGDTDNDGDIDAAHIFGTRSFSVWSLDIAANDEALSLVFDSSNSLAWNINTDELNTGVQYNDERSPKSGAQPEGLTIAKINGRDYVFVACEKTHCVLVYEIVSETMYAEFSQILYHQGDKEPEQTLVISSDDSPTN